MQGFSLVRFLFHNGEKTSSNVVGFVLRQRRQRLLLVELPRVLPELLHLSAETTKIIVKPILTTVIKYLSIYFPQIHTTAHYFHKNH
jgi:hypothetical protein